MIRIGKEHKIGWMDRNNIPAATCRAGETVVFETMDCSDGAVSRDAKRDYSGKYISNPATGPLYVEGACPGDVLKVTVEEIRLADWGFMGTGFGCDCFKNIQGDKMFRTFDLSEGKVKIGNKVFPVSPMIGVIGVAPAGEPVDTVTPWHHGGNMDCTQIGAGAEIYFPVNAEGALLAMGDLHAVMGDGEVFQYGLEAAGEVTVRVDVIKAKPELRMPAVLRNGVFSVIASGDSLEECSELAVRQMYDILVSEGWDRTDAGMLMSMKCDLVICQTVDPKVTVRAGLPAELIRA